MTHRLHIGALARKFSAFSLLRNGIYPQRFILGLIFSGEKVKLRVLRFGYKAEKCNHLGPRTPLYSPLGASRNFSIVGLPLNYPSIISNVNLYKFINLVMVSLWSGAKSMENV
jgi:hypothetical protein